MKQLLGFVLLLLPLCGYAAQPHTNIDNAQLKALIAQGVPVYDIRRPEEWRQTGVVEDSRLLTFVDNSGTPLPDFMPRFAAAVGKNDPVILICRVGNRTEALARILAEKFGYTRVYNVREGITRWIGDGNPVVQNAAPSTGALNSSTKQPPSIKP